MGPWLASGWCCDLDPCLLSLGSSMVGSSSFLGGVGSGHPEAFFLGQVLQRLCFNPAEMLCEQKRSALRGHSTGWIWCPAGLGNFHPTMPVYTWHLLQTAQTRLEVGGPQEVIPLGYNRWGFSISCSNSKESCDHPPWAASGTCRSQATWTVDESSL